MEEISAAKIQIREDIANTISALSESEINEKTAAVESRLFAFANFLESKIALLYISQNLEVGTDSIIQKTYSHNKIVVLPAFDPETYKMKLMKVDAFGQDLIPGPRGGLEPDPGKRRTNRAGNRILQQADSQTRHHNPQGRPDFRRANHSPGSDGIP